MAKKTPSHPPVLARREAQQSVLCFYPLRLLVFAVLGAFALRAYASGETLLGVLEEQQQCKEGSGIHVRALYAKSGDNWLPLDSAAAAAGRIPPRAAWIIALRGKRIGQIETIDSGFSTQYDWTYPRDRLLNVVPAPDVPSIPNQDESYAGWCALPRTRPLVAVTRGSVSDPENWQAFLPSSEYISKLFAEFKARNGAPFICSDPEARGVPFAYQEKDLRILAGYENAKGQKLITLALEQKDACGELLDAEWDSRTFLVDGETQYVGANLSFVDSGDYDADGASELLFWHSSYNRDGYVLLSSDTGGRSEFLWNYH
jgi:hypothetical protein